RSIDPLRRLDRVAEALVLADDPEGEKRAAVVAPLRVAGEDRVRDDAQPRRVDELRELIAGALAVHHDAAEPAEEPPPEVALRRRAARKDVVRREDERRIDAQ